MEAAVIEGLIAAGITVARLGGVATPMLYYSVHALETDGGIMITGSHNPPNHNGFKMMLGKGPFFGADIQDLGQIAADGDFESGVGAVEDADIIEGYVDRLLRDVNLGRQLKIVWDCGNGAAGPSVNQVCTRLPSDHMVLFPEIDGELFRTTTPIRQSPKILNILSLWCWSVVQILELRSMAMGTVSVSSTIWAGSCGVISY